MQRFRNRFQGRGPLITVLFGVIGALLAFCFTNVLGGPASASANTGINCPAAIKASAPSTTGTGTTPTSIALPVTDDAHIHYFAYDKGVEKDGMGAGTTYKSQDDAAAAFMAKFADPSWTALTVTASQQGVDYMSIDPNAAHNTATTYVGNASNNGKWKDAAETFCSQIESVSVQTFTGPYTTWSMHLGKSSTDMPTLLVQQGKDLGQAFVVKMKNGQVLIFRTVCGFQLSQPPHAPPAAPSTPQSTSAAPKCTNSCGVTTSPPGCGRCVTTPPSHSTTPGCGSCITTTPPTSHPTTPTSPPTTHSCPTGTTWNGVKCAKDSTTVPTPPTSAPGKNPSPDPTSNPGSNKCYSETTGLPVTPNPDGSCPAGSFGG